MHPGAAGKQGSNPGGRDRKTREAGYLVRELLSVRSGRRRSIVATPNLENSGSTSLRRSPGGRRTVQVFGEKNMSSHLHEKSVVMGGLIVLNFEQAYLRTCARAESPPQTVRVAFGRDLRKLCATSCAGRHASEAMPISLGKSTRLKISPRRRRKERPASFWDGRMFPVQNTRSSI